MSKILDKKPIQFPWEAVDPFLMCVHHEDNYPIGNENLGVDSSELKGRSLGNDFIKKDGYRMYNGTTVPGFPYHPHRGFETITLLKKGYIDHCDSLGGAGRFGSGDAEWMTAGKGILHSEMFPLLDQEKRNPLELFQIWINLPKKSKFADPHFKMLWKETIPKIEEVDKNGKKVHIEVYAGDYKGNKAPQPTPNSWASTPENGVSIFTIKMESGTQWELPASLVPSVNRTLYFYRGNSVVIDNQTILKNHMIRLDPKSPIVIQSGVEDTYFLLLQGKPINEPVVAKGPFVMNTEAEIEEAYAEFRKTQFGGWPWQKAELVHDRKKGRFALYENGEEELK
ncbi:pirin family protein [Aquimarina sp. 2201CG5-10]|uniref:pirin family protein n=1 Tax=Aquimarina callyspongiae TaxID=3098150 RepID=UPI002AB32F9B|nr:pirin family protein [Aquimarina sp. 2201CG5-10]MDY8137472.1 pirin-like C-terminal cupin domain-containing protein [Aquimarina sp. 2201CG5-10]